MIMKLLSYEPSKWTASYKKEKNDLLYLLSNFNIGISHIGATSVPAGRSDRNIDVLIVAESIADVSSVTVKLQANGYKYINYMSTHECSLLVKQKRVEGCGVTVRVVAYASDTYNRINAFMTYLRESNSRIQSYNNFREALSEKYKNDWKSYYRHKKDYINEIIEENFKFE